MIARRKFLAGLVGIIAAPAVVKAASLMRVSAYPDSGIRLLTLEEIERIIRPPMICDPALMNIPAYILPGHLTHIGNLKPGPIFSFGPLEPPKSQSVWKVSWGS